MGWGGTGWDGMGWDGMGWDAGGHRLGRCGCRWETGWSCVNRDGTGTSVRLNVSLSRRQTMCAHQALPQLTPNLQVTHHVHPLAGQVSFLGAMRTLQSLPTRCAVRLCTSDSEVAAFWWALDGQLEAPLEILDDGRGHAWQADTLIRSHTVLSHPAIPPHSTPHTTHHHTTPHHTTPHHTTPHSAQHKPSPTQFYQTKPI